MVPRSEPNLFREPRRLILYSGGFVPFRDRRRLPRLTCFVHSRSAKSTITITGWLPADLPGGDHCNILLGLRAVAGTRDVLKLEPPRSESGQASAFGPSPRGRGPIMHLFLTVRPWILAEMSGERHHELCSATSSHGGDGRHKFRRTMMFIGRFCGFFGRSTPFHRRVHMGFQRFSAPPSQHCVESPSMAHNGSLPLSRLGLFIGFVQSV